MGWQRAVGEGLATGGSTRISVVAVGKKTECAKVLFAFIMSAGSGLSKMIPVKRELSRGTVHCKMVNFLRKLDS